MTRSHKDELLAGQQVFDWPTTFRIARLYSAVDYIQASRARTLGMQQLTEAFAPFDVIVTPSQGLQLTATNLCGQPAVVVPNGIRGDDAPPSPNNEDGALQNTGGPGTPVSLAAAYQQKTGFHLLHPKI
jgi:hypothetical protein